MVDHGVNVKQQASAVVTPAVAETGVPFVIGLAPVQSADSPAKAGMPVLCTSWAEAVEKLGYSDDWKNYTLCEFMYSHFKLFACQPVIFCNVMDSSKTKETAEPDMTIVDHKIELPIEAVASSVVLLDSTGEYKADVDFTAYYSNGKLIVEMLSDGSLYNAEKVSAAYKQVTPASVTSADIAAGIENVELCLTTLGMVPDLICAPGFSHDPVVAAVMAAKAGNINGLFTAKALIDIDSGENGARIYSDVQVQKTAGNIVDEAEIACWPKLGLGEYEFHMSTQLAGLMAQVDSGNGCPYESPSNKNLQCDRLILADGSEVNMTLAQANYLNSIGVVTAINFINGWVAWGNYTACYPANTDVKDQFIPVSRTFGWVGNTLIKTYWSRLDKPMNRRLIDTIKDSVNIWLNGLVGSEYLLGARVEVLDAENPEVDLLAGIIRFHIYITPPSPAQRIDFILEYDASYVKAALTA